MSENKYSWDWQPSGREEAEQWLEITDHFKRANIAKSRFADEAIIRAIASHAWKWGYNDKENLFLPALLENPNLTPELLSWLDEQTRTWGSSAQHSYWLKRYEIQANSNYDDTSSKKGRIGTFSAGLLTENLDLHLAAKSIFEMADHSRNRCGTILPSRNISSSIIKMTTLIFFSRRSCLERMRSY